MEAKRMYFDKVKQFDLKEHIQFHNKILAHIDKKTLRHETLEEHLALVIFYLNKIIKAKNLESILSNFEETFFKDCEKSTKSLYKEMLLNAFYMHDVGKINCNFQFDIMENQFFKKYRNLDHNNSNHSMLSSIIYLNHFFLKIKNHSQPEERDLLLLFMVLNAYIMSKHHGSLDTFQKFKTKLLEPGQEGWRLQQEENFIYNNIYQDPMALNENLLDTIFEMTENTLVSLEKERNLAIPIYIYERFIASLLLSCDFYATGHFKNNKEIKEFGEIKNVDKYYDIFKNTDINKKIREYEKTTYQKKKDFSAVRDINVLRNELFLEAEEELLKNIDKNIFFLEAPTGSGKSNVAFNLSFKILEERKNINKVFYVYPFNTLIEQNFETLNKTFGNSEIIEDFSVINSVVPIKHKRMQKNEEENKNILQEDYDTSLLDRQFLHYPFILTTHVSMFNYLFGTSKDNVFPLYQMANSVIILDEIQSYKNKIWKEIIIFLNAYAKVLNIRIIIMSATLPALNKLLNLNDETIPLIKNKDKYFKNPIFKDRVRLDFSLLKEKENTLDEILNHVVCIAEQTDGNILIEFIKKASASKFYEKLIDYYNNCEDAKLKYIDLITGDDNQIDRKKSIDQIKKNKNTILVATQVIEAGVDIDMDVGYKDIAMLDSEEQFLGRINRSCKKKDSIVYFFDLDQASSIYKHDIRKEKSINLKNKEMQEILTRKDFQIFYEYVLKRLEEGSKELNKNNFEAFNIEDILGLNFEKVKEKMSLIDDLYKHSVFLNRTIKDDKGRKLIGEEIWKKYIHLLKNKNLGYAEWKVKLSQVKADLNHFVYQIKSNDFDYNDRIGDLYYIDEGEKYFKNGKFDRSSFKKSFDFL